MIKAEIGMVEAGQQQLGPTTDARKAAVEPSTKLADRVRQRILETLLEVAMTILFRVELRRIARQELYDDLRMLLQIRLQQWRAVPPRHARLRFPAWCAICLRPLRSRPIRGQWRLCPLAAREHFGAGQPTFCYLDAR